jgi:hypothetical protein
LQLAITDRKDDLIKLLCSWGADITDITGSDKHNWKTKGVSEKDFAMWQVSLLPPESLTPA